MAIPKPNRRLTLQQLLVHTEKHCKEVHDNFRITVWPSLSEFRDLARPVRKRSNFPTMVALQNSLNHVVTNFKEADEMVKALMEWLEETLELAQRQQKHR